MPATSARRRAQYVSPNSGSVRISVITVNGVAPSPPVADTVATLASGAPGCTASTASLVCTVTGYVPPGSDTFAINVYESNNATGTPLSTASVAQVLTAGVQSSVMVTLGGVPASIAINGPFVFAADGSTHGFSLQVTAKDSSGATIIAPGNYSVPISIAVTNDPNNAISLSSATLTAPSQSGMNAIAASYNGARALTSATISASASGTAGASTTLSPLVYSPESLNSLAIGGGSTTVTISEALYGGAFTISSTAPYADIVCVPASCSPAALGGSVTLNVTPESVGTTSFSISDASGVAAALPLAVSASSTGVTIPGAPVIKEFSGLTSSLPQGMTVGSDGNIWFTENKKIGRITSAGAITEYSSGLSAMSDDLDGIVQGPDGNLWFCDGSGRIGRITTSGVITEFSAGISAGATPAGIGVGADGNLWFTESNADTVGRITPAGTITEFTTGLTGVGYAITGGPDGNLWMPEPDVKKIARITTEGAVTEYPLAAQLCNGVVAGPDGNLWTPCFDAIERVTIAGSATLFSISGGPNGPAGITVGADGNLWFADETSSTIYRVTTSGVASSFSNGITANSGPKGIASGPDGNIWFTEYHGPRIGRLQF